MATTTNYGWTTPDDTALVKDGASAIRTLGSSVDTTTKNLNPETTLGDIAYRSSSSNTNTRLAIGSAGQVLTVAAGVPSWATPTDQTPLTTKGDLFTFSTVDARLAVGTDTYILVADSTEATGLKWAAPAGGGAVVQVKSTTKTDTFTSTGTSFQDVTGLSVSITPTSASNKIFVIASVQGAANRAVTEGNMQLMRGSTAIAIGDADGNRGRTGIEFSSDLYDMSTISLSVLDTPATTSATTYKVQIQTRTSAAYVNRSVDDANSSSAGRGASTITVMEVTP